MGSLLSRMYTVVAEFGKEKTYRVLMLGLDQAGKTTILYKIKLDEIVTTRPTIGFNIETVNPRPDISFEVWDAPGEEKYRRLVRFYFQNCQGFVFVVDSSDPDRFQEARDVLFKIIDDEFMIFVPFVVIANKSDVPMATQSAELIEQLNLKSISKQLWYFQSASAITGEGIHEAMQILAQMIKNKRKPDITCRTKN